MGTTTLLTIRHRRYFKKSVLKNVPKKICLCLTVSNTEPNLQNNSIQALRTNRHYLTIFLTLLLLCSAVVHGQDIPPKNEADLPKTTKEDTLTVHLKPVIADINEKAQDTVKTDTIKPEKEALTDVVDYYGEDYVLLNRKENKV